MPCNLDLERNVRSTWPMSSPKYLPLATVKKWEPEARRRGVSKVARSPRGFLTAYKRAGSSKALPDAWKRKRDAFVARHMAQVKANGEALFDKSGRPSRRHLALIMWAYSPVPRKLESKWNPILAKPPVHMHSLQGSGGQYFRRVVGRAPTEQDYYGVHTTDDFEVAMAYAENTATMEGDPQAYPVVVGICVDGLQELPDVDAMVKGAEAVGDLGYAYEELPSDVFEAEQQWVPPESEAFVVGQDPYHYYVDNLHLWGNLPGAFTDVFDDPQEAWDTFRQTGEVPPQVMSALVKQRRWPVDVGIERVVEVVAFQPVWREIFDTYWDMDDPELTEKVERIEVAGYAVSTIEDAAYGNLPSVKRRTIYESDKPCGRVEYHGTSSVRLKLAFPEMEVPPPPFPVEEVVLENPVGTGRDEHGTTSGGFEGGARVMDASSSPGHRMWLRTAVRELYPHVTMWVHYPQTEGKAAKQALFDAYAALPPKAKEAYDRDVYEAFVKAHGIDWAVAYRYRSFRRVGGASLTTKVPHTVHVAYKVRPEHVLVHWAQEQMPLGAKAFGHEKEIILRPDAEPREVKP